MAAELDYFHLPSADLPGGTLRHERRDIPALPLDQVVFHHSCAAGKLWRAMGFFERFADWKIDVSCFRFLVRAPVPSATRFCIKICWIF